MNVAQTCCFTGHRPKKLGPCFREDSLEGARLKARLTSELVHLVEERGVTCFLTGMALGIDQWAAEIALTLQQRCPWLWVEAVIPCVGQEAAWSEDDQQRYRAIRARCNHVTVLAPAYTAACMQQRNRYMVDHSTYVLAVWNGASGGTASTVRYARRQGKSVIVIDPATGEVQEPLGLFAP